MDDTAGREDVRKRLIAWRLERKWRGADVVRELEKQGFEITRQAYYAWEAGRNLPKRDVAVALAKIYGKTVDHLLSREIIENERVKTIRSYLTKIPEEDQELIEMLVKNIYDSKVLNKKQGAPKE